VLLYAYLLEMKPRHMHQTLFPLTGEFDNENRELPCMLGEAWRAIISKLIALAIIIAVLEFLSMFYNKRRSVYLLPVIPNIV
jgi:hypothetical protein